MMETCIWLNTKAGITLAVVAFPSTAPPVPVVCPSGQTVAVLELHVRLPVLCSLLQKCGATIYINAPAHLLHPVQYSCEEEEPGVNSLGIRLQINHVDRVREEMF